ncbi:MAG: pyrimidine reductase family protein [Rhodoglobus sp.]|nr:pyrimidine reductase family protein [Rhodoglobus sp.]
MTARIDRVWPNPAENLSDDDLVAGLGPGVRLNFVSSIDGAATRDGLSGGLSGPADKRHFELLRRVCDVVLVGAGTVRAEGYGPMRVSAASAHWRLAHGMPEQPVFAIVSGRLDLDPGSRVFTEAPVRPIVVTSAGASGRERFEAVADVVAVGTGHVDLEGALASLRDRGLTRVLCEGGPTLFGSLLAVDAVDELCITISPSLEGGDARRISHGVTPPRDLRLEHVLRSGETLLLRYRR